MLARPLRQSISTIWSRSLDPLCGHSLSPSDPSELLLPFIHKSRAHLRTHLAFCALCSVEKATYYQVRSCSTFLATKILCSILEPKALLMLNMNPLCPSIQQFLKGAYFDGFLELLAQWPSSNSLETLSIVQEPPPRHIHIQTDEELGFTTFSSSSYTAFAQPMVFFSLEPISTLARSPASLTIKHLRLRIPSRLYARELGAVSGSSSVSSSAPFPDLRFLDVSTSVVSEHEVKLLLEAYPRLEHLVLDATGLCGYGGVRNGWREVGRICAVGGGIERARARERAINRRVQEEWDREQEEDAAGTAAVPAIRPPAATAMAGPVGSRRRRPRAFGASSVTLRDGPQSQSPTAIIATHNRTASTTSTSSFPPTPPRPRPTRPRKVRILPPPCSLRTLSASTAPDEPQPTPESTLEWIEEFDEGWKEGIARLEEHWRRITTFVRNAPSMRLMVFREAVEGADDNDTDEEEEGANDDTDDDELMGDLMDASDVTFKDLLEGDWDAPAKLCFGLAPHQDRSPAIYPMSALPVEHRDQCGHAVGQEIWTSHAH